MGKFSQVKNFLGETPTERELNFYLRAIVFLSLLIVILCIAAVIRWAL